MGNVPSKASGPVSSSTTPGSPEVHSSQPSLSLHTRQSYTKNTNSIADSGHGSNSPTTSQSGHSLLLDNHPPVPPKDSHYNPQQRQRQRDSKNAIEVVVSASEQQQGGQGGGDGGGGGGRDNATILSANTTYQGHDKALPESPTPSSPAHGRAHSLASLLTTSTRALSAGGTTEVLSNKELPDIRHITEDDDADSGDRDDEDGDKSADKGRLSSLTRALSGSSTQRIKRDATPAVTSPSTPSASASSSRPQAIVIQQEQHHHHKQHHPMATPQEQPRRAVLCARGGCLGSNDDGEEGAAGGRRRPSTSPRVSLSSSLPSSSLLSGYRNSQLAPHRHSLQQQTSPPPPPPKTTTITTGRASLDDSLALRRFATGETLLSEQQGLSRNGSLTSSSWKRSSSWMERQFSFGQRSSSASNTNNDLSPAQGDGSVNGNGNGDSNGSHTSMDQHNRSKNNQNPNASRSTSVVSSRSGRSSSGSSPFKFSKPNLSFMPLYNHSNESKRQNASAAALQGASTNNIHNNNNNINLHGGQQQQQHQQPASPFPEELLSMRLPQSLLNKYVMDTESFRHGKGFWGIGRYSWTITVQARSNGKKYVIKRVAKSLLPPEAYYRYPTTAHRLCTCPACKSRREQLLQSGQLDPKDVEEVLALQYNSSSNGNSGGGHSNNNGSGNNSHHTRGHRREHSQHRAGVARPSQPSSPSASSSNLNLLGLGALATTLVTTNKEKRASGGSILPLQRVNSMSPTRLFARSGSGGGGIGRKSNTSSPQGTPAHSRPSTPMMTPLSRPGSRGTTRGSGGALKKREARPTLRRCASTPSLSRARTGLDALDEDPLVVQLRAATRYPLSKTATSAQETWREFSAVPKVRVTLTKEMVVSSSSSSSSSSGNGHRGSGDQAEIEISGDDRVKEIREDDDEEAGPIFSLEEDQEHALHQHPHIAVAFEEEEEVDDGDESDEEDEDEDEDEDDDEEGSADEAWIAPGCAHEEPQSPVRSPTPFAAAAAAAVIAGLALTPSTSFSIQQPNYVPPPHSLPMELVLLQTYNDSDHLPEHHEWTQDQDYWYYVTKAHGVKRPKLKKISSWWSEALGGGHLGGGAGSIGGGSGAGPAGAISLLLTAAATTTTTTSPSSSLSTHALSSDSIATGPIYNMSMPPAGAAAASKHGKGLLSSSLAVNGSSPLVTTTAATATTATTTALTTNGDGGDGSNGHSQDNGGGSGGGGSGSSSSSKSSSSNNNNNMLTVPTMKAVESSGPGQQQGSNGERFLNVHGLASDVSLISLDSNGYIYNNYSTTPTGMTNGPLNKTMAAWTKRRHGSPRNYSHSSKYYYVDWDEYLSL
ncbi:hypothetical protein DFQ27_002179 [Actinomortierella ambigua]|uniref:Uncharacterized protein n=1 Tax=Actinomortierella ambigua TaxID=1343610 RepID=A0A9P6UCX8_9FUNG|nr:hypothetical protein DFQ27_002179 [Actinomortierella ambigua]